MQMRRFIRYLLRVLVLFVVFMGSALLAMRFAIHGRQTEIPKLVGLTPAQAERTLAARGLVMEPGDRFFSAEIPAGRIMSQAPPAGLQVRRGWRVRVAESMGPQRVVIPDLIGQSERAAEINIRRRGLELGSLATASLPDASVGQIVAQSPPANAINISSPKISVLLAAPEERRSFVMPDLVSRGEDDAINAIVGAGLRVWQIHTQPAVPGSTNPPQTVAVGTRMVVGTVPAAGQRVYEGQGIGLEVTR